MKKIIQEIINIANLEDKKRHDLTFCKNKVIEECSELINELVDSLTKRNIVNNKTVMVDNTDDIILEMADLKIRMKILEAKYEQEGYENFSVKVKKAKKKKLLKILEYRKKNGISEK